MAEGSNESKHKKKGGFKGIFKGNENEPRFECPVCEKTHKTTKFGSNQRCCHIICMECLKKHCKGKSRECECPFKGCPRKLIIPEKLEDLHVDNHPSSKTLLEKLVREGLKQPGVAEDDEKSSKRGSISKIDPKKDSPTEHNSVKAPDNKTMDDSTLIMRPALGRNATIGDFYDAKADNLLSSSILLLDMEDRLRAVRTEIGSWKVESITAENVFDRMNKLEVCPETQLSILSGQLEPRGHAEYLNSREWNVEGENKVHGAFVCTLMLQALNISRGDVGKWMSLKDNTELGEATHVVVGIDYGLRIVVSATKSLVKEKSAEVSKASLEKFLSQVNKTLNNPKQINADDYTKLTSSANDLQDYKITIFSDMAFDNLDKIETMNDAIKLVIKMAKKNCASDSGIIVPIRYRLLTISAIAATLKVNITPKNYQCSINSSDAGVKEFVELLDKTEGKLIKLKHFLDNIESNEQYVSNDILDEVKKGTTLAEDIRKFKERLQRSLQNSKSGIGNVEGILSDYKIQLQVSKYPESIDDFLSTMIETLKALKFVKYLKDMGVICMEKDQSLEDVREENKLKECCVFFYSYDETIGSKFDENKNLFLSLLSGKKHSKEKKPDSNLLIANLQFIAADIKCCAEQLGHLAQYTQVCYYSESCNLSNVLKKIEKDKTTAVAKPLKKLDAMNNTPIKFAFVELPCPGSFKGPCSKKLTYNWQCSECSSLMEFDFGNKTVYCTCGQGQLTDFEFKCNSKEHGENFIQINPNMKDFKDALENIKPIKCSNILLLGETGVGKSTWINAFVNYGTFRSLDEASNSELIYAIPTSFSMTINKKLTPIAVGSSANERSEIGQSATQSPVAYRLYFEDTHIRLIDTPGMGDTRGIEQDRLNMEVTMNFLSQFEELHAICILLKPNDSRLTTSFLFCINQILTHLHKDASKNIIFCLTNSRATKFEPGQTWELLDQYLKGIREKHQAPILLSEKTVYCFDSEAFRYLCALSSGAKFKAGDKSDYSNSWKQSVDSTLQLLNNMNQLKPHKLHDTVSLSNARNLIDKLTGPMIDIGVNIEKNRAGVSDQKKIIETLTAESQDLEEQLKIKMVEYEPEPLEQPRMVCASSKCRKIMTSEDTEPKKFIYEQVCHEPCWLDGVEVNAYPNPVLQKCAVIDDKGLCKRCRCRWEEHMHVSFTYKEIVKENPILEEKLHEAIDKKTSIEKAVEMCDKTAKELESELELITECAAKFAQFLKTKSILPYNDAFDNYMAYLMENHKFKDDPKQMESLEEVRKRYKQQIELLNKASADDSVNVDEIHKYKDKLIKQKHSGAQLNKILNVANEMAEKHAALKDTMCRPAAEVTRNVTKKKKEVLDSLQQLLEIEAKGD